MYAHTDNQAYVTLYAGNSTEIPLDGGKVGIKQETEYPFDGKVKLTLSPAQEGQKFILKLRIPTWAREKFMPGDLYNFVEPPPDWEVKVNGESLRPELDKGFAVIKRQWKSGDTVQLDLPMPVQFNTAIEKVKADIGRVAVTRGPLVYCAEGVDNDGLVQRFTIPKLPRAEQIEVSTIQEGVLEGVKRISFPAREHLAQGGKRPTDDQLLRKTSPGWVLNDNYYWPPDLLTEERSSSIHLVPYYSWANRDHTSMIVWIARGLEAVHPTAATEDAK